MKYAKRILILLLCLCFLASCAEAGGESNVVSSQAENSSVLSLEDASSVAEDEKSVAEDSSVVSDNSSADESVDVSDTSSEDVVEKRPIDYEVLDMFEGYWDMFDQARMSQDTWEELLWLLQDPTRIEGYEAKYYTEKRSYQYVSNQLRESGYICIPTHPYIPYRPGMLSQDENVPNVLLISQCKAEDTVFTVFWQAEDSEVYVVHLYHTRYNYEIDLENETFVDYLDKRFPRGAFLGYFRSSETMQLENEMYKQGYYVEKTNDGEVSGHLLVVLDGDYYAHIRCSGSKEDLIAFAEELQFEKYVIE